MRNSQRRIFRKENNRTRENSRTKTRKVSIEIIRIKIMILTRIEILMI